MRPYVIKDETREHTNKPGYFINAETHYAIERQARKRLCKELGITNRQFKKRRLNRKYRLAERDLGDGHKAARYMPV